MKNILDTHVEAGEVLEIFVEANKVSKMKRGPDINDFPLTTFSEGYLWVNDFIIFNTPLSDPPPVPPIIKPQRNLFQTFFSEHNSTKISQKQRKKNVRFFFPTTFPNS